MDVPAEVDRLLAPRGNPIHPLRYALGWHATWGSGSVVRAPAVARHRITKYAYEPPQYISAAIAGYDKQVTEQGSGFGLLLSGAFHLHGLVRAFSCAPQAGNLTLGELREDKRTVFAVPARLAADAVWTLSGNPQLDEANEGMLRPLAKATGAHSQTLAVLAVINTPASVRAQWPTVTEQTAWRTS
ncbi:hypothetical protein [Streptomyces spectabilis]|uniref:Uncharacterized protein n=1 Tax=Streptomyces spectabilis TaxID=68270 RepID=A0A7W8F0N4_STRST|nr:hypothetical protein [Streptomyces spectabilis]MBB5109930.1 hypothetical protein [Streptomyces spectabilis]